MFNEISLVDLTKEGPYFDKFDALRKMNIGKKVIDDDDYIYESHRSGITRKYLEEIKYMSFDDFLNGKSNQFKEYIKLSITKIKLIENLKELKKSNDEESAHIEADNLLLEYINEDEITQAFKDIDKWYA